MTVTTSPTVRVFERIVVRTLNGPEEGLLLSHANTLPTETPAATVRWDDRTRSTVYYSHGEWTACPGEVLV